jgi:uncharacterized protein (TIGR03545 family)
VPASHGASQPQRRRGVDLLFAGLRRHPDYLVRSIEIHGKGRHLGETFDLSGTILGLSSQPALQDRPTIVKIAGRGALAVDVLASIDRRGDVPIDRLVIRCPAVQRPAIELGHSDSFALTLAGGRDEIEAKLKLTDNQLNGTLSWRIQDGGLRVAAHHTAAAERLADAMNAGLAEIGPIGATLHLGGSLAEPTIRMESELGSDVLVAMQSAATQEVARQRQELETALKQYVQDKLVEVDRVVDNHRRWLEQNLNEQRSTLIRLVADTSGYGHLPAVRMSSSERSEPHGSKPATYQR